MTRRLAGFILLSAAALGFLRVCGMKGELLQWAAHSFVTWMFVAWRYEGGKFLSLRAWLAPAQRADAYQLRGFWNTGKSLYFYVFVGLSILELLCFTLQHGVKS